ELGRVGFKERDVSDLLTLYGVKDPHERESLLKLARDANNPGWWHRYGDVLPTWFQSYLGLEAAAALIRSYEVQFVPGLLQTRDYARAVVSLGHRRATPDELDRRVDLRMQRQQLLHRPDPPQLWAVVDEAALRRPIGGREVMRGQLTALIEATRAPHVRVQVIPFDAGGHAAAGGAFTILRFGDQDLPDIVYIEQLTSAIYLDKREDLDFYAVAMERLCVEAEPPERTPQILTRIMDELYR
ncbi:transcriptional regulator, partial [Micromonospora fluostatini]